MARDKKHVTVTRNANGNFIHKHTHDEPREIPPMRVFESVRLIADTLNETNNAIYFLSASLAALSETGRDLGQTLISGLSSVLLCLSDNIDVDLSVHSESIDIMHALASGELEL